MTKVIPETVEIHSSKCDVASTLRKGEDMGFGQFERLLKGIECSLSIGHPLKVQPIYVSLDSGVFRHVAHHDIAPLMAGKSASQKQAHTVSSMEARVLLLAFGEQAALCGHPYRGRLPTVFSYYRFEAADELVWASELLLVATLFQLQEFIPQNEGLP